MEFDFVSLVQTLGIPTAMCLWFMFRVEKLIKANTDILAVVAQLLPHQGDMQRMLLNQKV